MELYILAAADFGEDSNEEAMPMPTNALPVELLYQGYDVWIDGNRGTLYQSENTLYNRN